MPLDDRLHALRGSPLAGPRAKSLELAVLGVGALAILFFLVHELRAVAFPYPLDYGEGPLLEQARRLAGGDNIYRPTLTDYPFTIANYPPVYPLLLALVGKVVGFTYPAARVVSFLGAGASAWLIASIVRHVTGNARASVCAAALFLANPYVVFWATLARIDLVALPLSLAALLVMLRASGSASRVALALALAWLASMTRQSHLLAAPAAIVVGLAIERRWRALGFFVAAFAAAVAAAVFVLDLLTHGGFLLHTVTANRNHYSFPLLSYFLGDLACTSGVLLALALAAAFALRGIPRTTRAILVTYLVATALSALTIGKVGSHVNYFLEIVASSAIFGGLALARIRVSSTPAWVAAATTLAAVAAIAVGLGFSVLRPQNMEAKLGRRAEFDALASTLRAEPHPVLADETMGLLVLTGHSIELQPFEFTQLARQGEWDDSRVVRDIREGRFGLILINDGPDTPDSWTKERWTSAMLAAVHGRYAPNGALGGATLYRPAAEP